MQYSPERYCLNPCCNGRCTRTRRGLPSCQLHTSLNPCCNGRCTRTQECTTESSSPLSLNPCCNGRCTRTLCIPTVIHTVMLVLILVVMEDALALVSHSLVGCGTSGLNPCCNGRCTRTPLTTSNVASQEMS